MNNEGNSATIKASALNSSLMLLQIYQTKNYPSKEQYRPVHREQNHLTRPEINFPPDYIPFFYGLFHFISGQCHGSTSVGTPHMSIPYLGLSNWDPRVVGWEHSTLNWSCARASLPPFCTCLTLLWQWTEALLAQARALGKCSQLVVLSSCFSQSLASWV